MSLRALPCVLVWVSLAWPSGGGLSAEETRGKTAGAEVRLRLEDQANRLVEDIPGGPAAGEGKNVTRLGATPSACAGEALRRTKAALERAALGRVAIRSLEMKVGLEPALLKQHRVASAAHLSEIFYEYLESSSEQDFARRLSASDPDTVAGLYRTFSSSRSDQLLLISPDAECGVVRLLFEIRSLPARARPSLRHLGGGRPVRLPRPSNRPPGSEARSLARGGSRPHEAGRPGLRRPPGGGEMEARRASLRRLRDMRSLPAGRLAGAGGGASR